MSTTTENVVIQVDERGARVVKRSIDDISQSSKQASANTLSLKNALAGLGLGVTIQQVTQLVDSYTNLINRLRLVTTSTENLSKVNRELFELSNRTRSSYAATAELYSKFATATERLGLSQAHLLTVVESVNKATILSGVNAMNAEQGLRQLAQGISSGVLRGDELTSILENLPKVASVIAEGMGKTVGDLKVLGEQGKITAQDIISAFDKAKDSLNKDFASTIPTIGSALTVLKNNLLRTFGELDQGSGISAALATAILDLSGGMDTLVRSAIAAALALGVNYAVQGVGAAITATRALTAAIAANPLGAIATGTVIAVSALVAFSDQIMVAEGTTANLADVVSASFESIGSTLNNVVTAISEEFPQLKGVFEDTFGSFNLSLGSMLQSVASGVDNIVGIFVGLGDSLTTILRSPLDSIVALFEETFNAVLRSFTAWINLIIGRLNAVRSTLGLGMIETIQGLQIPLSKSSEEIGKTISDNIAKGIKEQNSAQKAVEEILARSEEIAKKRIQANALGGLNPGGTPLVSGSAVDTKVLKEQESFLKALREEEEQIGKTKTEVMLLKAAELGLVENARPIIDSIEAKTKALNEQEEANRQLKQDLAQVKRLTEEMFTPQEKLNAQIAEFDRLIALPNNQGLSLETYNRLVKDAQEEFSKLKKKGQDALGSLDQYAVQAARNIQTSLANFLFDPFEDGLKGMVKGTINAVRRMVAEFAALKISQGLGLANIFAGGSNASGSTSGTSGFNLLSGGLNIGSLFKSGFGLTSMLSNAGGKLPGSIGSFFTGMGTTGTQAAAESGAAALWGSGGASTAASMGASFASFAGPAIAIAAVDQITRMLMGDKTLGGTAGKILNFVPILGPLINGLFGRGPMKQGMTTLKGSIGAEGFESGALQTRFDAKGGAFRSNKTDFATVNAVTGAVSTDNGKLNAYAQGLADTSKQIIGLINDTTKQVSTSLYQIGTNLGISTTGLDNFTHTIKLVSKAGKGLTEEQIAGEISKISDELARSLLPNVADFAKSGERATDTLTRLSQEFGSLQTAATKLGASSQLATDLIKNMSIGSRTALVELAGGMEALSAKTSFFAQNFLTDAEKLEPVRESLRVGLESLGVSANITKEQFRALVQDLNISNALRNSLLDLAPAFIEVLNADNALIGTTTELASVERSLTDIRGDLVTSYQKERTEISATVDRFRTVAAQLSSFRRGLLIGDLSPLTPGQKLDETRSQFNQTRTAAFAGDQKAIDDLPAMAQNFLEASRVYNASGAAYLSDFALVQDVLKNGEAAALSQVDIAKNQLEALDHSVSNLIDIKDNTKTTADAIRELNVAVLTGKGNPRISTNDIQGFLRSNPGLGPQDVANAATSNGVSLSQLSAAGYDTSNIVNLAKGANVTDSQIREFLANSPTPQQIYDTAKANGISFQRLSVASGISIKDMEDWSRANNLPVLDRGTDFVTQSGIGMLHRGEAVVESTVGNKVEAVENQLIQLRAELKEQSNNVVRITALTNAKNAETIVESNTKSVDQQAWKKRSGTKRK